MAVYTCFDMVHDCVAGEARGWIYFVRTFAPALRAMMEHYGVAGPMTPLLMRLKSGGAELWHDRGLVGERDLLVRLRPLLVAQAAADEGSGLDLEGLASALEPLTVIERQTTWLDAMHYEAPLSAVIMRIAPETAGKMRRRAGELLRASMDNWSERLLRDNGAALQRQAQAAPPEETVPMRDFLDVIDGRVTWMQLARMEKKLASSWYEIDHFCCIREADHFLRTVKPLRADEEAPLLDALGVKLPKQPLWKRVLGSAR